MRTTCTSTLLLSLALVAGCAERHEPAPPAAEKSDKPAVEAPAKRESRAEKHAAHAQGPSPLEAVARLSAGNARFATGRRSRSAVSADDQAERSATAKGQHPFAAVLTCADSRLPPELIFDQSVGDIFVVRNAGNVAEPVGEGSLEYAVEHLGVRLIVVMGHSACGAVQAVTTSEGQLPGNLAAIQRNMAGLREVALAAGKDGQQPMAVAVPRNAGDQAAALLKESEVLRKAVDGGSLAVLPAVYDLDSGLVEFLAPAASVTGGDAR